METIGRVGKITEADMATYVKEENEAQLNEQAEQEWEDGDFDDTEAQITKDEADEELRGELKREKAKLVAEAGARMKERVAAINAEFSPTKLDGIIVDTRCTETRADDISAMYSPLLKHTLLFSPMTTLKINRFISASNWRGD